MSQSIHSLVKAIVFLGRNEYIADISNVQGCGPAWNLQVIFIKCFLLGYNTWRLLWMKLEAGTFNIIVSSSQCLPLSFIGPRTPCKLKSTLAIEVVKFPPWAVAFAGLAHWLSRCGQCEKIDWMYRNPLMNVFIFPAERIILSEIDEYCRVQVLHRMARPGPAQVAASEIKII